MVLPGALEIPLASLTPARTGLLAGVVASLCCISPVVAGLLLLLVGVDVVGASLGMETFRWPLLLGGLGLVGAYGAITYRRQACCTTPRAARRKVVTSVTVMASVYLVATLVLLPVVSGAVFQAVNKPGPAAATAGEELHQLTLQVNGMYCPSCPGAVEHQLESVPGVVDASVSFPDRGVVLYDAGKVAKETVAQAVRAPYSAQIIKDEPA